MKKFKEFMTKISEVTTVPEEYDSLVSSPVNKRKYPIFKNPDRSEIKDLAKETNLVRFIAHKGDFYTFNGALLHAHAINHLKLPISHEPPIEDAFLGVAKASSDGRLSYYDSNQLKAKDAHRVDKLHPQVRKYLT